MLSKSAARAFFLVGTGLTTATFVALTVDTFAKVPAQTNQANLTESAIRGKDLWDANNCMGCHTILGEGAYYAPELTKVFERRGEPFIRAMLKDPQSVYPGQRRMQKYDFTEENITDLVAFLKWIGEMDLNGFPPKPDLGSVAVPASTKPDPIASQRDRPQIFNQMCIACHALGGQGGTVGPALDKIGDTRDREFILKWLRDPPSIKPGTTMPKLPLTEANISELAAFLTELKSGSGK